MSSNVLLDTGQGSTATGYCINQARADLDPRSTGMCSFWDGTGGLVGFHAVVDVSIDASQEFHGDGVYYYRSVESGDMPRFREV
ncbi:MAG: hypothetical protein HY264_11810 [Chloroflexi bacterium]|nr:hypothetical protein [Chloroflexota bacterium]